MTSTTIDREPVLAARTLNADWNPRVKLTFRVYGGLSYHAGNRLPYFSLTSWTHRKGLPNQCQSGGCNHEEILKLYPQFADLAALHLADIHGVPMHAEANGWYSIAGALPGQAGKQYNAANSPRHFPKEQIDPAKPWNTTNYRNPTADECLQIFADHVRCSLQTAIELRDRLIAERERDDYQCPACETIYGATFAATLRHRCAPCGLTLNRGKWEHARAYFAQWIEEQKPRWLAEAQACIANHSLQVYGTPYASQWPVA